MGIGVGCSGRILLTPCYANSRELGPPIPAVSEGEFEEIMNRNRAISSSAISKAVSGASAGIPMFLMSPIPGWIPAPDPQLRSPRGLQQCH